MRDVHALDAGRRSRVVEVGERVAGRVKVPSSFCVTLHEPVPRRLA
jgi:hypothetical protein